MTPVGVGAKVTRGAHIGWICWWNSDLLPMTQLASFRTVDGDGDGMVGVALGGTVSSGFCAGADLETGEFGYGRIGTEAGFGELPPGTVMRDPSGAATNIGLEDDGILLWVRPGAGAWYSFWRSDVAENAVFYKTSDMAAVAGGLEPVPAGGFARGDLLVALIKKPGHGYGSRVDADLDRTQPGRISFDFLGRKSDVAEGEDLTARVVRTGGADGTVSVRLGGIDGTAIAGRDYEFPQPVVTLGPGEVTKSFTIRPIDDDVYAFTRTFTAELRDPAGASLGSVVSKSITITENDLPPMASFGAIASTFPETNAPWTLRVPVVLTGKTRLAAVVSYSINERPVGKLTIPAGQGAGTIEIPIRGDDVANPDQTFTVSLDAAEHARRDHAQVSVTIIDDDVPRVAVPAGAIAEDAYAPLVVHPVWTGTPKRDSGYSWSTVNGTAIAGIDYIASAGSSEPIRIHILPDDVAEGPETFYIELRNLTNVETGSMRVTMTILDDDAGLPEVSIESAVMTEGAAGTSTIAKIPLRLSEVSPVPIQVSLAVANGTASSADYTAFARTVTIPPGALQAEYDLTIIGDDADEPDETVAVHIDRITNAIAGAPLTALFTIVDDDPGTRAYLSAFNARVTEGTGGTTNVRFRIQLAAPQASTVTTGWTTSDITATAGADYTTKFGSVMFAPGETEKFVDIAVHGDAITEPVESFSLTLYSPMGGSYGRQTAEAIIVDDDTIGWPRLSIADVRVNEGDAAKFTLSLSAPPQQAVHVSIATISGTATAGIDFEPRSQQVTFAPGETSLEVVVPVRADRVDENDETFELLLTSPMGVELANDRAVCTIVDDDMPAGRRRTVRH